MFQCSFANNRFAFHHVFPLHIVFVLQLSGRWLVSASIVWSGIIQRSGTCIGREQAPDCVLPADALPPHPK